MKSSSKTTESLSPTEPIAASDRARMLAANRFQEGAFARNGWGATVPNGTAWETVLSPWYWRLVGRKLRIGDEIVVRDDALSFWALLLVVSADPITGAVELRDLLKRDLAPVTVVGCEQSGFSAVYRGLTEQWCILRDHDEHTMRTNLPSRDEAMRIIRTQYLPSLAAQRL